MFGVISAQAHLLPITVLLAMVAIGIELRVQHFVEFLKKPQVPVIGTLVHTFTFPLIAICLVLVVFTFELPLSEPLLMCWLFSLLSCRYPNLFSSEFY